MVKQLRISTFFLILSCADLRWNEILVIIRKLNEVDFDILSLSYRDRCKVLNENPLLVARHLRYRVEFFKTFCCRQTIRKNKVLFHLRRVSSKELCTHLFIWILNAPNLTLENIQEIYFLGSQNNKCIFARCTAYTRTL